MPTGYVKQLAKEHGMSLEEAEEKWKEAMKLAKEEENVNDYFAYVTAIFKSLMGESKGHGTKNKTTEQRLKRP